MDLFELYAGRDPFDDPAGTSWCGGCAACRAVSASVTRPCGCPESQPCHPSPPVAEADQLGTPVPALCLHQLGRQVNHGLFYRADCSLLPLLDQRAVLATAVAMASRKVGPARPLRPANIDAAGLTFEQALSLVISHLQRQVAVDDRAQSGVNRMAFDMAAMVRYMGAAMARPVVRDVTTSLVAAWMTSDISRGYRAGCEPAANTQRHRRSSARLFFRVLRDLGLYSTDPTLDLPVPERVLAGTRPLEDDELVHLRYTCENKDESRPAAILALLEATATSGEAAQVQIKHVDFGRPGVLLVGSDRRTRRWAPLSAWGVDVLRDRIADLRADGASDDTYLVYAGDAGAKSASAGISVSRSVSDMFAAAGLAKEPNVKPKSIGLALGRRIWEADKDIALVARTLGLRSMDAAAKAIGVDPIESLTDVSNRQAACLLGDVSADHQRGRR